MTPSLPVPVPESTAQQLIRCVTTVVICLCATSLALRFDGQYADVLFGTLVTAIGAPAIVSITGHASAAVVALRSARLEQMAIKQVPQVPEGGGAGHGGP